MSHENEHERLDPVAQRQVERRLAGLAPAPAQVDRDRLMFLAGMANAKASGGRESPDTGAISERDAISAIDDIGKLTLPARRERRVDAAPKRENAWHWPAATAALAATSLAFCVALMSRPEPQAQIVYVDRIIRVAAEAQQQREPGTPRAAPTNVVPITLAAHQRQSIAVVPADNYVRTREVALRMGLDAIGSPRVGDGAGRPSTSYGDWLQSLADESGDTQRPSGVLQLPNM